MIIFRESDLRLDLPYREHTRAVNGVCWTRQRVTFCSQHETSFGLLTSQ